MTDRFRLYTPSSDVSCGPWGLFRGPLGPMPPSWAHLCHQPLSAEVNVGQCQGRECACGLLGQAAVAHLAKAPQPLDHAEHVLHPRAHARLVAILGLQGLVVDAVAPRALVGEVPGLGRLAFDQFLLAGIGRVTVYALLVAMEQTRQRGLSCTLAAVTTALCASPLWLSTPMCSFMPKYHCWPLRV